MLPERRFQEVKEFSIAHPIGITPGFLQYYNGVELGWNMELAACVYLAIE
jgi:hypothetical protein